MPSSVASNSSSVGGKRGHKLSESDGLLSSSLNKSSGGKYTKPSKPRQLAFSCIEGHRTHAPHVRRIKSSPAPSRFLTLSLPKQVKSTWETSFWPELRWGNQEPIRPISRYALTTNPSRRVEELAVAKKNCQEDTKHIPEHAFSCGRSSPIWEVQETALKARPSDRVLTLAKHKEPPQDFIDTMDRPNNGFSCGRSSPIWEVSDSALTAKERPRTARLASAKTTHSSYKQPRPVQSAVSKSAKTHTPSERVVDLAMPKRRYPEQVRPPQWEVSEQTKSANASSRTLELSKGKSLSDGYQPSRDVAWPVNQAAMFAVASSRLEELAKPIKRQTMDHLQFNPDAFKVASGALKANPSKRLEDLSQPLERLRIAN